jgi:hypothetical protein
MAVERNKKPPWGSVRGPQVLIFYLIGLVAVYVGERLIGGRSGTRWIVSGAGAAAVLLACLAWLKAWLRTQAVARRVERLAAWLAIGGLVALVIYLLSSELVLGPAPLGKAAEGVTVRQVLAVAWPILLVAVVLPLIFMQISTIQGPRPGHRDRSGDQLGPGRGRDGPVPVHPLSAERHRRQEGHAYRSELLQDHLPQRG